MNDNKTSKEVIEEFSIGFGTRKCSFCNKDVFIPDLVPHIHECMEQFAQRWNIKMPCGKFTEEKVITIDDEKEQEPPRKRPKRPSRNKYIVRQVNCRSPVNSTYNVIIHVGRKKFVVCRFRHFSSHNCNEDIKKLLATLNNQIPLKLLNNSLPYAMKLLVPKKQIIGLLSRDMPNNHPNAMNFCSFSCACSKLREMNNSSWEKFADFEQHSDISSNDDDNNETQETIVD